MAQSLEKFRRAPRIFAAPEQINSNDVVLSKEQANHIIRVLRKKPGDTVAVLDGQGRAWITRIKSCSKSAVTTQIVESVPNPCINQRSVQIALGSLKGDSLGVVLQKCTEIGVEAFHLVPAERSIARVKDPQAKLIRCQSILTSAAEQCGAFVVPRVHIWERLDDFFKQVGCPSRYIAWENETAHDCRDIIKDLHPCILASGPEGGFSEEEVKRWTEHGFKPVSLGPHILRAETAPIALAAIALCVTGCSFETTIDVS